MVLSKTFQYHCLIFPVVLTVVGSAVKVTAQEKIDISSPDLETIESYLTSTEEQSSTENVYLSQLPSPITPRTPEQPTPTLPLPQEEPLEPTPPTPPTPEERPQNSVTITVERFEFVGNTAFSNEELGEVLKPFIGKPIGFAELLQAEAAVTKKYTDAGYINSGAVIPAEQTLALEAAVVKIQIIEGGIEDIKVTGTRRLNSSYVRSRLGVATSKPLAPMFILKSSQVD